MDTTEIAPPKARTTYMMARTERCQNPNCQKKYHPRDKQSRFCSRECRILFNNLRRERGAEIYELAMDWRRTRAQGTLVELTRIIDQWRADDKAHGQRLEIRDGDRQPPKEKKVRESGAVRAAIAKAR